MPALGISPKIVVVGKDSDHYAQHLVETETIAGLVAIQQGQECRCYLQEYGVQGLVVLPELEDVSPLNMVAAVRQDIRAGVSQECTILLLENNAVSGSLASRASVAGVDQIVSEADMLTCLVNMGIAAAALQEGEIFEQTDDDLVSPEPPESSEEIFICDGQGGDAVADQSDSCVCDAEIGFEHIDICSETESRSWVRQGHQGHVAMGSLSAPAKQGMVVAVASAAGGAGVTTCAVLLAEALSHQGISTALLDCNLQFGDLRYLFQGVDMPRVDELAGVISDTEAFGRIARRGVQGQTKSAALAAAPATPESADLLGEVLPHVVAQAAEQFGLCIVDLGCHFSQCSAEILAICDLLVGVCDQRSTSLFTMEAMLNLAGRIGVPQARQHVLLNRFEPKAPIDQISAQMALKGAQVTLVSEGGKEVDELLGLGCPSDLFVLKNPLAKDMDAFATALTERFGLSTCKPREEQKPIKEHRFLPAKFLRGGKA